MKKAYESPFLWSERFDSNCVLNTSLMSAPNGLGDGDWGVKDEL